MKTAVSIPDEVFREADRAADRLGLSRSQLYARAIREYLDRQGTDPVTAALDELASEMAGPAPDSGRTLIESGSWEW